MFLLLVELEACSASCTHGTSTVMFRLQRELQILLVVSGPHQLAAHEEEQRSCSSGLQILLVVALALLSSPHRREARLPSKYVLSCIVVYLSKMHVTAPR